MQSNLDMSINDKWTTSFWTEAHISSRMLVGKWMASSASHHMLALGLDYTINMVVGHRCIHRYPKPNSGSGWPAQAVVKSHLYAEDQIAYGMPDTRLLVPVVAYQLGSWSTI